MGETGLAEWTDYPYVLGALVVLNFPLYRIFARWLFDESPDYEDLASWNIMWATVGLFFVVCAATVAVEYLGVSRLLNWVLK